MTRHEVGAAAGGQVAVGGCAPQPEAACVPDLSAPADRLAALVGAVTAEAEPLVTLTHLLRLCRDEHPVLWARVSDPPCRERVACMVAEVEASLPAPGTAAVLDVRVRQALASALEPGDDTPPVVIARALAELLDARYGHTFAGSFARRSPYQPRVGDPVPLDGVDVRRVTALPPTAPPWRLANRLDETRRVRLAGEWAAQFRMVFDYCLADTLAGVIEDGTVIATCHPNASLDELDLPRDRRQRSFPIRPADPDRQREEIHRLIGAATAAGARIVVLPELCVTESLAAELQAWVLRPNGPRLLVAGSYHHADPGGEAGPSGAGRRRNTAVAWIRGSDRPISYDKHSPADRPFGEDIQPEGWPELRIHVTADGWHLVLAICRDLLNPLAVHALTEAGVNLVLAPAMSETLVPFGGPVAQLVAANQALVVVANNPAQWPDPARPSTDRRPARALFGHPGFGQQARFVPGPDPGPGLARLHVHSGALGWLPAPMLAAATPGMGPVGRRLAHPTDAPGWVARLAERTGRGSLTGAQPATITLQTAAVLVLLTDAPAGPRVLLTRRATDLADYPGKLVFPGGATDRGDRGPVATALREAREEIGLDPDSVQVIGLLPAQALTDSGFLVTPVLAWAARPAFPASANLAEVDAIFDVPLLDRAAAPPLEEGSYGRMTAAVLDLLEHMLTARPPHHGRPAVGPGAPFVDVDVVDRVDEADPPRTGG